VYHLLLFSVLAFFWVTPLSSQMDRAARYQPGDWVSYGSFHYVTSFEEGDQYLYIGTTYGVLRFDQFSREWDIPYTISNGLSDGYVLNIVWVSENRELWVITRAGIDVISTGRDRWFHIQGSQNVISPALRQVRVGQTGQSILILTPNGQTYEYDKFNYSRVGGVNLPAGDGVWKNLQPTQEGITNYLLGNSWHVNELNNTLVDNDFTEYPIVAQFTSSRGERYLGTWGGGFIRANATTNVGEVFRFGPVSTPVGALANIAGNIWFGGAIEQSPGDPSRYGRPGISFWVQSRGEWTHFPRESEPIFRSSQITSIDGDEQRVWVGTNRGLLFYQPNDNSWSLLRQNQLHVSNIFDVLVIDSSAWVGTDIGLFEISHPGGQVRSHVTIVEGERIPVYSLTSNRDGIFAGTEYGLIHVNPGKKTVQYFDKDSRVISQEQFRFSRVYQVTFSDGKLFYADNMGLYQFDISAESLTQLPKLGLVARSSIRVLEALDEKLWIGLDTGVAEYDIEDDTWEFYTTEDGLAANRIFDIYVASQFAWFATQNGVTRFRKNWSGSN